MMGFLIFIHTVVCILLCVIVLMQSGRGGGLTEAFASGDSVFGAQTNEILIKATSIFASIFLVTCLSLAFMSSKQDRSLIEDRIDSAVEDFTIEIPIGADPDTPPVEEESGDNANQITGQAPAVPAGEEPKGSQ